MRKVFDAVMRVVSSLLGVLLICMGGIWILQGLDIAFQQGSFMGGQPEWAVYGALLAAVGVAQVLWSNTRQTAGA